MGSTFYVRLPLETSAETPEEAPPPFDGAARANPLPDDRRRPNPLPATHRRSVCRCATIRAIRASTAGDLMIVDLSTHAAVVEEAFARPRPSPPTGDRGHGRADGQPRVQTPDRSGAGRCQARPSRRVWPALCVPPPASALPPPTRRPRAGGSPIGAHVLLVEDEAVNAAVAQGYLAELGCTCVWVDNGSEAVARSSTERFDLIMMDLNMPSMDGFAATRLIREREAAGSAGAHHRVDRPRRQELSRLLCRCRHGRPAEQALHLRPVHSAGAPVVRPAGQPRRGDRAPRVTAAVPFPPHRRDRGFGRTRGNRLIDGRWTQGAAQQRRRACIRSSRICSEADRPGRSKSSTPRSPMATIASAGAVCHKLASSAANVGALVFASHVRQLEKSCNERDAARAVALYRVIRGAHRPLLEALTRLELRVSA